MNHSVIARLHICEMIEEHLAAGRVVRLSKDGEGAEAIYHADAGFVRKQARSLEGCIEKTTDHPRMKVCLRPDCAFGGKPTPISEFGDDGDSKDGHAGVCFNCESKRVSEYAKRRKSKPRAAAS